MVININPNRINVPSGGAGRAADRGRQQPQQQDDLYTTPKRSDVNYIPAPDSLSTLISSAISALRRGIFWDRGTIINLLV
jgi:hypothetical protein